MERLQNLWRLLKVSKLLQKCTVPPVLNIKVVFNQFFSLLLPNEPAETQKVGSLEFESIGVEFYQGRKKLNLKVRVSPLYWEACLGSVRVRVSGIQIDG